MLKVSVSCSCDRLRGRADRSISVAFVLSLEAEFPSTVSTVVRTSHKLGMRSAHAQTKGQQPLTCPLCGLPKQDGADEWRRAITVSQLDPSYRGGPETARAIPVDGKKGLALSPLLCYSCLLVLRSARSPSSNLEADSAHDVALPPYVLDSARAHSQEPLTVRPSNTQTPSSKETQLHDLRLNVDRYFLAED